MSNQTITNRIIELLVAKLKRGCAVMAFNMDTEPVPDDFNAFSVGLGSMVRIADIVHIARSEFNVNEYVWVKLTDLGRDHYGKPCEEINGWSKWQMHTLMHEFGPLMGTSTMHVPFDPTIAMSDPNK